MLTYGFYNALEHDRKYTAEQVSSIFDGVIEDGVYSNIGEFLATVPGTGLQVVVKTGRAWFNHTWTLNDSWIPLDLDEPDFIQNRIDAVVLEVDSRVEKRVNTIKIIKGVPSVNQQKPTLINTGGLYQHALAYVTLTPGKTDIIGDDIEIVVGKSETPFVQCPLKTVSIEDLWQQWDAEFNAWFDNLKETMTDNVVTNLQKQIDERVKIADKATIDDVKNGAANKWIDSKTLYETNTYKVGSDSGTIVESKEDLSEKFPGKFLKADQQVVSLSDYPALANNPEYTIRHPDPKYIDYMPAINGRSLHANCLSENSYIGEYDICPSGTAIYKIKDSAATKLCDGFCYLVYDNKLYVGQTNSVSVYDASLNLLKTLSMSGGSVTYMYPTSPGHIIGFIVNETDRTFNIFNTQNDFGTYSVSGFPPNENRYIVYTMWDNFFGGSYLASNCKRKFSMISEYSGKLYTYCIRKANQYGDESGIDIYVSSDYGLSWSKFYSHVSNNPQNYSTMMFGVIDGIGYIVSSQGATVEIIEINLVDASLIKKTQFVGTDFTSLNILTNETLAGAANKNVVYPAYRFMYLYKNKILIMVLCQGSTYSSKSPCYIPYTLDLKTYRLERLLLGGVPQLYSNPLSMATPGVCGKYSILLSTTFFTFDQYYKDLIEDGVWPNPVITTRAKELGGIGSYPTDTGILTLIDVDSEEKFDALYPKIDRTSLTNNTISYTNYGLVLSTHAYLGKNRMYINGAPLLSGAKSSDLSFANFPKTMAIPTDKIVLPYSKNGYIKISDDTV